MPVFHFKNELKTLDATARLDWQPNSWLAMRAGYEQKTLRYTDQNLLSPTASIVGEARDDAQAFFFKPDVEISALRLRFCLSPVVHFDQAKLNNGTTARTENRWTPSMSAFLSYGGSHYLYAKGSIGRAFRMPTFADLFYQDFRVQGKADLRPEKSLNREVGIGARLTAGGIWSFDAAVFRNTIQDMIVWRLGSFEFFRPYNTDAELIGEDYNFSYSTAGNFLRLNVGYSHLRPLNKDKNTTVYDKLLPYRPEHSVKASLDLAYAAWQTSLMYRGLGARFVTEANTKSMPAYAVLDWTFAWRLTTKKLAYQLEAAIFNLLDEQYQIIRDMPLPGREWRMGLQVSY